MTNEEKLAEIRHDLERLRRIQNTDNTIRRCIDRLESDLARLTAPRGKTFRIQIPVFVKSETSWIAWEVDHTEPEKHTPRSAAETIAKIERFGVGHIVNVDLPVPLREVPVVEGSVEQ